MTTLSPTQGPDGLLDALTADIWTDEHSGVTAGTIYAVSNLDGETADKKGPVIDGAAGASLAAPAAVAMETKSPGQRCRFRIRGLVTLATGTNVSYGALLTSAAGGAAAAASAGDRAIAISISGSATRSPKCVFDGLSLSAP